MNDACLKNLKELLDMYKSGMTNTEVGNLLRKPTLTVNSFFKNLVEFGIISDEDVKDREIKIEELKDNSSYKDVDCREIIIQHLSQSENFKIEELHLNFSTENSLKRAGIKNTSEINSIERLKNVRGFGQTRINELLCKWEDACKKERD